MATSPGPVPNPLIPFFKEGHLKTVMRIAEEYGTGLPFINAFRKLYPKDPQVTQEEYFGWLSYLSKTARAGLNAGLEFQALDPTSGIDPNLFPANYFIRPKNPAEDRYLFNISYESVNEETRQVRPFNMSLWFNSLPSWAELVNQIGDYVQQFIDIISTSAKSAVRYMLLPGSLSIDSIFRRF